MEGEKECCRLARLDERLKAEEKIRAIEIETLKWRQNALAKTVLGIILWIAATLGLLEFNRLVGS